MAVGKALSLISLFLQQGKALTVTPAPLMRRRFLATWQKVHEALSAEPGLRALALLWMQETQESGRELPDVLNAAAQFGRLLTALRGERASADAKDA
jgi:hypothetical protein